MPAAGLVSKMRAGFEQLFNRTRICQKFTPF
jgi:hypothetical protein